jgi:hypothetical protein
MDIDNNSNTMIYSQKKEKISIDILSEEEEIALIREKGNKYLSQLKKRPHPIGVERGLKCELYECTAPRYYTWD